MEEPPIPQLPEETAKAPKMLVLPKREGFFECIGSKEVFPKRWRPKWDPHSPNPAKKRPSWVPKWFSDPNFLPVKKLHPKLLSR